MWQHPQAHFPTAIAANHSLAYIPKDVGISLEEKYNLGNLPGQKCNEIPRSRETIHNTDFGLTDTILQWFSSYLTDRIQYVCLYNHCSAFTNVHSGVPQGSVLGPMLFTMYIKPLSAIIDSHTIIHQSFADDLQIQMSAPLIEYLSYFTLHSHV